MSAPISTRPSIFPSTALTADQLAIEQLVVPLAVVDIAYKAEQEADYLLSRDDLAAVGKQERTAAGRLLRRALLRLGRVVGHRRGEIQRPRYRRHPPFSRLCPRGGGVDDQGTQGGGHRGRHPVPRQRALEDFKTHRLWLSSGRWGLENVANLGKVPASGATLVVGAPKVKDATGGLTRVLALV